MQDKKCTVIIWFVKTGVYMFLK